MVTPQLSQMQVSLSGVILTSCLSNFKKVMFLNNSPRQWLEILVIGCHFTERPSHLKCKKTLRLEL